MQAVKLETLQLNSGKVWKFAWREGSFSWDLRVSSFSEIFSISIFYGLSSHCYPAGCDGSTGLIFPLHTLFYFFPLLPFLLSNVWTCITIYACFVQ